MIRQSISKIFADTNLVAFIQECRLNGRKYVPPAMQAEFSDMYNDLLALLESSSQLDANEYATLRFAVDFCNCEKFLAAGQSPRYNIYTNLDIMDTYIGVKSRWSIARIFNRCRQALALLLNDWMEYERTSFEDDAVGQAPRLGFDRAAVLKRIVMIRELYRKIPTRNVPLVAPLDSNPPGFSSAWEYFASGEHGAVALVHATCLPQSNWHDEYLFIRTLHCMEVCFWAIIISVRGAAQCCSSGLSRDAVSCLKEGNTFAGLLIPLFDIFKTMPIENFKTGFRDETGDSSAIQSTKYQTLDLLARGFSARKTAAIGTIEDHKDILNWTPPQRLTLAGIYQSCCASSSPDCRALQRQCLDLDFQLRQWRGDHLGVVRTYLGVEAGGTGGEGYDYLFETYKDPNGLADLRPAAVAADDHDLSQPRELLIKPPEHEADKYPQIGLIWAYAPAKATFLEQMSEFRADWLREMNAMAPKIHERFNYYDGMFSAFSYTNDLEALTPDAVDALFETNIVDYFERSLMLRTGLMVRLVNFTAIQSPLQFCLAADGTPFGPGRSRRLKDGEIYLSDEKSPIVSYFRGPVRRVILSDPRTKPQDGWSNILCIISSARDMPSGIFTEAMATAEQALKGFNQLVNSDTVGHGP
jgi:tryptophan 2,3-dioxygenase